MDNNFYRNEKKKPEWLSKSNFLSLLNLPEIMKRYGPLRLYWEGTMIGEKAIQEFKPYCKGLKQNWQEHTLNNFYLHKVFDFIIREQKGDENQPYLDKDWRYCLFDPYENKLNEKDVSWRKCKPKEDIEINNDLGKPLKAIYFQTDENIEFYVPVNIQDKCLRMTRVNSEDEGTFKMGLSYFEWNLSHDLFDFPEGEFTNCLFLPYLVNPGSITDTDIYAVISSEWESYGKYVSDSGLHEWSFCVGTPVFKQN